MKRIWGFWIVILLVAVWPAQAQEEALTYATAQRYEHGLMIWRADTGEILALAGDGRVLRFPSVTYATLPDNPIFGTPPSRLRPIFGMGKVWGNFANVRRALGWPTLEELGFNMPVRTSGGITALTQLDGSVIQIAANGTWQRTLGDRPAPYVLAFTASPDPADLGGPLTLNWQVQGTDRVLIEVYPAGSSRIPVQLIQDLPLVGSTTVTIPASFSSGAHVVLWGVDRSPRPVPVTMWARRVSQSLTIGTRQPPGLFRIQAAYQPYERGFLIWRADSGDVMAFGGSSGGQMLVFDVQGYAGWPDTTEIFIPTNRVRPVNAFGKVWSGIPQVRDMLGYATGPEQGYTAAIHLSETGLDALTLPDQRIIHTAWGFWNF
ncbi:MAG: hypothetical protein K8J31_14890 [Anaerolineae bacterium]|nr:hypothetical protein [Anaerolineae bacterium]